MEIIAKLRDTTLTSVIKKHCRVNQPVILKQYSNDTLAALVSIPKILGFIPVAPKVIGLIPEGHYSASMSKQYRPTLELLQGRL